LTTEPDQLLPNPDTIRVFQGREEIRKVAFRSCQEIQEQMDGCYDHTHPYVLFADDESHKVILDLIGREIRLRYLTQVTKHNLPYCKKMIDDGMDVRHLDGVKGNFSIVDRTYCVLYTIQAEGQEPTQLLVTNSKSFVEQQQHFFEILWRTAIPAEKRIKELEREQKIKNEFIEEIADQLKVRKVCDDLVLSTTGELLIVSPSQEIMESIIEVTRKKSGVKVRILEPIDKLEEMKKILKEDLPIEIRYFLNSSSIRPNVTILLSEGTLSLSIEIKENMKANFYEMIKSATYTNSESIVWTHTSIFETLWMQSKIP
jgi:hypothetical protein